jgi:hypothetical protein
MGEHPWKADGRRFFSTEFKRATVQRILTGEKTLAEVSHEPRYLTERDPQWEAIRRRRGHDGRPGQ